MDTKKLKQKILDLAIRGKLVPQDPNDEPASVLVARIREEKECLIKEKKLKRDKNESYIYRSGKSYYEKRGSEERCIDSEIPFEIPNSWQWVRLGSIAFYKKGPFGSSITKSMFVPKSIDSIKVYEQKNAIYKDSKLGDYYITNTKFEELKGFEVNANDIIVSCAGTIGETFIMPKNIEKGIINQALMLIRLFDCTLMPFYLLYFDFVLKKEASNQGKGTAIKNIPPFDILKGFLMPLPPISEQERIIIEIKEILRIIDSIGGNKTDLSKAIKQAKAKVLDLAIRGKLVPQDSNDEPASVLLERIKAEKQNSAKTSKKAPKPTTTTSDNSHYENMPFDIPKSWVWTTLGKVGLWQSGATPTRSNKDYYSGNIPWLKTGDLNDSFIDYTPENITELAIKETSLKLNPTGSVLIAMYGATIGKLGILNISATTNQACCACSELRYVNNRYLFFYLLSLRKYFISIGGGGAQPNISKEKIVSTSISVPPYQEQFRIVDKVDEIYKTLNLIEESLI